MSNNREMGIFLRLLWEVSNDYVMPEGASKQMIQQVLAQLK